MLTDKKILAACALVVVWLIGIPTSSQDNLLYTLDCEGKDADTQLCIDKEEAFLLKAKIEVLYEALVLVENPPWDGNSFDEVDTSYQDALDLYDSAYFSDAKKKFEKCLSEFTSFQETLDSFQQDQRAHVKSLLSAEKYEEALPQLQQLLVWDPEDNDLVEQLQRAQTGVDLIDTIASLRYQLSAKQFDEAEALLTEIPDGYWTQDVQQAQQLINRNRVEESFNTEMSSGYQERDAENWDAAKKSFTTALKIIPGATVAVEALAEVNEHIRNIEISSLQAQLNEQELAEQWEQATVTITSLEKLVVEPASLSEKRNLFVLLLNTERRLLSYQQIKISDLDQNMREEISGFLDESAVYTTYERIRESHEQLTELYTEYTTPVVVTLVSDGRTNVRISPGQDLGKFKKKTVEIIPGFYEVIGTRRGFRQVVEHLGVKPGEEAIELEVVCSARF